MGFRQSGMYGPAVRRLVTGSLSAVCLSSRSLLQTHAKRPLHRKRLTNAPVRGAGSVLKCLDDHKNRVVGIQATYPCGSSAVGGRVYEQRNAQEPVLSESGLEFQHTGSPSEETALEKKAQTSFFGRPVGEGGVGRQEITAAARRDLWAGSSTARRAPHRGTF